jgi:hypothetical protein
MKFYKLPNGRYLGMDDQIPKHIIEQLPELIESGLIETGFDKTYDEQEFQHATNPPAPTWNNTLTNHLGMAGDYSLSAHLAPIANNLGYIYFSFNNRIYKITTRAGTMTYAPTEFMDEDLPI